jgi:hypothetical protein
LLFADLILHGATIGAYVIGFQFCNLGRCGKREKEKATLAVKATPHIK